MEQTRIEKQGQFISATTTIVSLIVVVHIYVTPSSYIQYNATTQEFLIRVKPSVNFDTISLDNVRQISYNGLSEHTYL